MSITIRFLGTAAFEIITASGERLLIDPYLDKNPCSPYRVVDLDHLDLLLVTHAAYDHIGDAETILRRFPDLHVICGSDVRGYLIHQGIEGERLVAVPWGMMVEEANTPVRAIYSRHGSYIQTEDGQAFSSVPLGFMVDVGEDQRVYHSGDTTIFSDMKLIGELYQPTVGLLNVGVPKAHRGAKHGVVEYLSGEMDGREAAMASQWLKLNYAIPCHHDDPTLPEVVRFADLLEEARVSDPDGPVPILLSPGQFFRLSPEGSYSID